MYPASHNAWQLNLPDVPEHASGDRSGEPLFFSVQLASPESVPLTISASSGLIVTSLTTAHRISRLSPSVRVSAA